MSGTDCSGSRYQALQNDSKNGKLYELLQLFASKDLGDFNTFYGANGSYVDGLGLKKDECVLKMRLLSLCTLVRPLPI